VKVEGKEKVLWRRAGKLRMTSGHIEVKNTFLQAILQERTISDLPRFGNCDDESSKDGPSEVNKGVATFAFPDFMECHPERMRLV
jgi:hypothetical protein